MGSIKKKVDKVANKVADKIMPKELAKVMPYIAMAAPFLGPVGMLATLPAQALADAKNYGKLNYKKLALQAAMAGIAKAGGGGNLKGAPPATGAEKAFSAKALESGVNPRFLSNDLAMGSQAFAENAGEAFTSFAKDFSYAPGLEGIGQRVADTAIKTGRSMNMPLEFGEGAPSISDQIFNMDRAKQAALMLGPMTTYAGMDAIDQMENAGTGGSEGTASGPSAQSMYNDFIQSGRLAGYTDEEINTIYGPYGDMASGTYDMVNVDRGPRRRQFPGTNYNLFTYANGGRAGFSRGGIEGIDLSESAVDPLSDNEPDIETLQGIRDYIEYISEMEKAKAMQLEEVPNPVGRANGGIMQAPGVPQGMELDYRNTGGFIPMGGPEKADDVPAMLSKNEFVMTADAVRGMGGGDVNLGAQKMYDLMNSMEAKV